MFYKLIAKHKTYVGEIKNGIPHGKGKTVYSDGRVLIGEWKKGISNGRIEYFNTKKKDSMNWIGIVKNENRIKGTETYPEKKKRKIDGFTYIGHYKNDKYNGKGLVFMDDGFKYYGNWKNGMKDGIGVQYEPNEKYPEYSDLFKGLFKNGELVKNIKELKHYNWNYDNFFNINKFRDEFKDFYKKNIKSKLLYSYKTGFKKY